MKPDKKRENDGFSKGKGKPGKGRQPGKDPKDPKFKEGKEDKPYLGRNSIAWRTNDEVMTELVARLPFGVPSGLGQPYDSNRSSSQPQTLFIPGVLNIKTRLGMGGNTGLLNYNTALNLAGRKLYSFIRHANSGSKNYEAADLTVYLIAIQQSLGLLGWLQRLYAVINIYSATNRYTPKALIKSMGVDFDDLIANQPQLKYLIAWFGRAIGALAFPDLRIMHASYEAYKWIIRDSDSPKEQFYLIDSAGFGKYDPVLSTTGGGVTYTTAVAWGNPTGTLMKFTDIYSYVHEIMDVLLSDEDCGIISGDILKAYRDSGLFKIEAFGDYDPIVKDDEILQQIHNMHVLPEDQCKIVSYKQNSGGTSTAPYVVPEFNAPASNIDSYNVKSIAHYFIIDAFSKVPDAKEVVNCSILNIEYDLTFVTGANQVYVDSSKLSFDLHLPVAAYMVTDAINATVEDVSETVVRRQLTPVSILGTKVANMSAFDWHPYMVYRQTPQEGTGFSLIGDKQNFRIFTGEVGNRIHENSILSLLNFAENNFNDKVG